MDDMIKSLTKKRRQLGWTIRDLAFKAELPYADALKIELGIGTSKHEAALLKLLDTVDQGLENLQVKTVVSPPEKRLRVKESLHTLPSMTVPQNPKRWAKNYDRCLKCRATRRKHVARGLCSKCYRIENEKNQKRHVRKLRRGRVASKRLTKEYLVEQYLEREKSPTDIAIECGCTRQFVHKMIKVYQIPLRDKASARNLALDRGKLKFVRVDEDGQESSTTLQKLEVDETFFSSSSAEMAWVLGIIYADGNLFFDEKRNLAQLSISQKEPELLEKVKALMKCNVKLVYTPRREFNTGAAGELYRFAVRNHKLYSDLLALGLKPNKSLNVSFPNIPPEHVRHFVRGCWDGDGSVYIDKARDIIVASFVSGSLSFIKGILSELETAGLKKRTLYINTYGRKNPSYSFKFQGSQSIELYHYLYNGVPREQFLERKHSVFKKFSESHS
jgi:hypothetical protein